MPKGRAREVGSGGTPVNVRQDKFRFGRDPGEYVAVNMSLRVKSW